MNDSRLPPFALSLGSGLLAVFAALALAFDPGGLGGLRAVGLALGLAAAVAAFVAAIYTRRLQQAHQELHDLAKDRQTQCARLEQELERHGQLEQQLRQAKQDAESAVMAKGEFLATMSHEIRTPLNGIVPMLDLLMSARLPMDQQEMVHTAFLSSQQMLRIVDDILDYSKLEASKLQLETTSFNLRETLESVIQLMDRPAQSKGLRLSLSIDPAVRLLVRGDPVRLRQVLSNLMSNAVKFTERGSVSVNLRKIGETHAQHQLRFEVRDTGIGISQAAQQRLFQAFSQADTSTTRLYGGTGLGLAISKRIIDLMGGRIGVDSVSGQGANFWFEIPLLKVAGDMTAARPADMAGARVLLISSDGRLRTRLNMLLPSWEMRMTAVESTQEGLDRLRAAAAGGISGAYTAVLADLASVRSTAVALMRNLERQNTFGDVRLICLVGDDPPPAELEAGRAVLLSRLVPDLDLRTALSGGEVNLAMPSERPAVAEIPAASTGTSFIEPVNIVPSLSALETPPPVAPSALPPPPPAAAPAPVAAAQAMAGDVASPPPADARLLATAEAAAPRPLRVLLVEDNPVNLMVGQRLLGVLGTHCDSATNGEAALLRMQASRYDLVLMDCQMPVMDGYTATRRWREHEAATGASRRLPIIAMTANAMAGDRQKCLDAGMDDYLAKPVTRGELERCLEHWRQADRQGETSQSASAAAAPAGVVAPAPASEPAGPVLDMGVIDELRSMLGNEVDRLIEVFLDDTPKLIAALETAAVGPDYDTLRNAAHTLKSSSANLGAVALSAAAKKVEHGARSRMLERPAVAVALIANEFARTRQALKATMAQNV